MARSPASGRRGATPAMRGKLTTPQPRPPRAEVDLTPGPGPVDFILTRADERLVAATPPGLARLAMAFGRLALVLH
jgi:hypothetical protein